MSQLQHTTYLIHYVYILCGSHILSTPSAHLLHVWSNSALQVVPPVVPPQFTCCISIFFLLDPVKLLTNQAEQLTQDDMLMNDRCNGTAYASKEQLLDTEKE